MADAVDCITVEPLVNIRVRIDITGAVQGVGFRPFVYRLARQIGLHGWIENNTHGVTIEAEGADDTIAQFKDDLIRLKPPHAIIRSFNLTELPAVGYRGFDIRVSTSTGAKTALVLPDIATCPDCLRDITDPTNRRYRYPFTNCTNCGPRFSIIESLPYDRPNTTMRLFKMCDCCRSEYDDPDDRRFHAQPNACPDCGPHLVLWSRAGEVLAKRHEALLATVEQIRAGKILAVKGLGGFHLMVDARNRDAVSRLRERKRRQSKPLALMFPSLETVGECCIIDHVEEILLSSSEAPIVLLHYQHQHQHQQMVTDLVAPGNPYLGVMLPYTPLHHLLLGELGFPVVATSGNLSDEPICIDEREALERLKDIADLFLVHNRPIFRHVDDSIVRVIVGEPMILRRARGYAPLPVVLSDKPPPVLAVGGHLKNSVAITVGSDVFISQHIGDLETPQAYDAFEKAAENLGRLYDFATEYVACDLHPDYASTKYAEKVGRSIIRVQHHIAHVLSCMVENCINEPVLGVAWDGTGYGLDGTVWGGEFLIVDPDLLSEGGEGFTRIAHFRQFRLPGGDQAVVEPRRAAVGLLYELYGDGVISLDLPPVAEFSRTELKIILSMLKRGFNSPLTSSVGRLFDAIASITGIRQMVEFEGQAAMELEFAALGSECGEGYKFTVNRHPGNTPPSVFPLQAGGASDLLKGDGEDAVFVLNWDKMIGSVVDEVKNGAPTSLIARKTHNTLICMIASIAELAGINNVVLSGGCFQNKILLEGAITSLRDMGFKPFWHHQIPTNDGGIAVGQAAAAAKFTRRRS